MPTYQYACSSCKHEFEIFQAFSDTSLTHCPECNGELRKVYSAVGVVFKGPGFYKTDSKSDSKGHAKPAASTSKEAQAAKSTTETTASPPAPPSAPSSPAATKSAE